MVAGPAINDLIGGQTPMAVVALTGQVIARLCCKSLKTPGDKFPARRRISRYHVGADQLQAGGPLQPQEGLKFGSVTISIATETVSGGTCLTYMGLP